MVKVINFLNCVAFALIFANLCEAQCPDCFLNTPQIIKRHGYEAESHIVETDDGFLLTVHRIPKSRNGTKGTQPVFLQHGLFASSGCWVTAGNNSLAFVLADQGYDVWLGNARGNEYSRAHIFYPPSSAKFWNFSWHEMGTHDLPAVIEYVANETDKDGHILYVGHSMGTTMSYVFSSLVPDVAQKLKAIISLAPVAFMTNIRSPIRYIAPWVNDISFIAQHLGINEFLPSSKVRKILSFECESKYTCKICENFMLAIAGVDRDQVNKTVIDIILSKFPAGTSTKTVLHYLQVIGTHQGDFKQYDYGINGNLEKYGQTTAPPYPLDKIKVPIYLMYGDDDLLASPIDVRRLLSNLGTTAIGSYDVPLKSFNHLDFLYARDILKLVYDNLIGTIRKFTVGL